jgi:hypothetical protein
MKKFLFVVLGLFLLLVVVVIISSMQVTGPVIEQPAAEEALPPVIEADTAVEAVSPSSAYSRKLRGVFMHSVTCTPTHLRLGDSIDVEVTDAWLERQWEPKSGGLFSDAEPDFSRGYALDSTTDTPRSQLVLAFAPTSRLGHLDTGGWRINLSTDTYKEHGFDRSRGNQLVMYFSRSNAVFPMKFNLYTDPKPCPDCRPRAQASFTISK